MELDNAKIVEAAMRLMDQVTDGDEVTGVYIVGHVQRADGTTCVRTAASDMLDRTLCVGMLTVASDHERRRS